MHFTKGIASERPEEWKNKGMYPVQLSFTSYILHETVTQKKETLAHGDTALI